MNSVRFSYISEVCRTKTMLLKNELLILKRINTLDDKQIHWMISKYRAQDYCYKQGTLTINYNFII